MVWHGMDSSEAEGQLQQVGRGWAGQSLCAGQVWTTSRMAAAVLVGPYVGSGLWTREAGGLVSLGGVVFSAA